MKRSILAMVALLVFSSAATASAAPPLPLPNPDRPAVTPILRDSGASASSGASVSASRNCPTMRRLARRGNSAASLSVVNLKTGRNVCSFNARSWRMLASNMKLFTTATVLSRMGPSRTLQTRVYAAGKVVDGTLHGNLFLKGAGDPSFGTRAFLNSYLGGAGSEVQKLATQIKRSGINRVTGRVFGDDTVFDRLRGVADSGYATSPWIGPLSGLSFNAGYTSYRLDRFSSNPARLAARSLARALRARGVDVTLQQGMRKTPAHAMQNMVARQVSPDMSWMARITNVNSVNFWAEMLIKKLGAEYRNRGTTIDGARVIHATMNRLGVKIRPRDGSGLTRGNKSTAADVVRLLSSARKESWSQSFFNSLPTAGVDGTLASRMRGSAAERRCHAKTGTLTGVTTLSGYCMNASGRQFAFSILMNDVYDVYSARAAQDQIAAMIARF